MIMYVLVLLLFQVKQECLVCGIELDIDELQEHLHTCNATW